MTHKFYRDKSGRQNEIHELDICFMLCFMESRRAVSIPFQRENLFHKDK